MKKNKSCRDLILLILLSLSGSEFYAQATKKNNQHINWRVYYEPCKESLNEGYVIFEAQADSGFQFFAKHQLPQLPVGVEINLKPSVDFSLSGELLSPTPNIEFSHQFKKPIAVYRGKVIFRQKIVLKTTKEISLGINIENEETNDAEQVRWYENSFSLNVKPKTGVKLRWL